MTRIREEEKKDFRVRETKKQWMRWKTTRLSMSGGWTAGSLMDRVNKSDSVKGSFVGAFGFLSIVPNPL